MIRQVIDPHDVLLNRKETAKILGLAEHTLACWRSQGRGPKAFKFGTGRSAAIRYRKGDIEAWLADPVNAEATAGEPWREERRQATAVRAGTASRPRRRRARAR